jgi:hypothetical protein
MILNRSTSGPTAGSHVSDEFVIPWSSNSTGPSPAVRYVTVLP